MSKGTISVGGDFTNEGKTKIYETDLQISGSLIQRGELTVNDPHKFLEAVVAAALGMKDVAQFGKKILDLLKGNC